MAKRYQEMEKRGQIGQKFGSNQKLDKAGSNQGSRSGSTKGLSSRFKDHQINITVAREFLKDINRIFDTDLYSFKSSNEKINSSERRRSRESLSGSRSRSTPDLILKRFRSICSEERN